MGRPTQALILLKALTNNWRLVKQYASPKAPLIPVLKANAYGHGAVIVALHLQKLGVKAVAVALIEEVRELRKAGFKKPIFLLGPFDQGQVKDLIKFKVTPIIGSIESLRILILAGHKTKDNPKDKSRDKSKIKSKIKFPVHLKWDTSMNRLGFRIEELLDVINLLETASHIEVKGLCTHLLRGEDLGDPDGFSARQVKAFQQVVGHFKENNRYQRLDLHVFNSDAFFQHLRKPIYPLDFGTRLGLGLYGYTSVETELSKKLKPVMKLCSKIAQIKIIQKGESVSYNATWTAQRDSVIAVVPMGYADGYRRTLSNKGQVLVRGMLVSVVGIVCMDYFMIDVTDVHRQNPLTLGEDVELWGPHVDLKELAKKIDTIPYELLTTLGPRVARVAVDRNE
jgi:alanine racemase